MKENAVLFACTACAFVFAAADRAATRLKTKPRHFKPRFWLCLAIATIVLVVPASAQAENVVPNPGFEIPGCSTDPNGPETTICGWPDPLVWELWMFRDTS